jgi:hypothetical protein
VPPLVRALAAATRERDELVAEVDPRHRWAPAAQLELEVPPVPGERLVDVSDLERHVVDADCPRHADAG